MTAGGKRKVEIYDSTLRDGAQGEGVSFSTEDQTLIVRKLDEFGIDMIEGGQPASNPKAAEFFRRMRDEPPLRHAQLCAFGSTHHPRSTPEKDANVAALLEAGTHIVTIFGKSWRLHARDVLRVSLKRNLSLIEDTIRFLVGQGREVIYDAEHFFDGYKDDPGYAMETLLAAQEAGARTIVLCDTNGGTLPDQIYEITSRVREKLSTPLGIHTHNDIGCAVANSLMAVAAGATHIQGTINGYGERCGNADLCSVMPSLKFKLGSSFTAARNLGRLTQLSHYISEIANQIPRDNQPYVGRSAFAHKAGMHIHAMEKNPLSFEHIEPSAVGNRRRYLISEVAGRSAIISKATELGVSLDKNDPRTAEILQRIKQLEHEGYQFEGAEASLSLIMRRLTERHHPFFELRGFRVIVERSPEKGLLSEATVKLNVGDELEHTAAEGGGPVEALDLALRKALEKFYPVLKDVRLTDFKVRILNPGAGTAAKTRVLIESADKEETWSTVGVSENIIEASYMALVDSIEYRLLREEERLKKKEKKK